MKSFTDEYALTSKPAKRRDPLAWLAAADLYQERGDQALADLWRARGVFFSGLHAKAILSADRHNGRDWVSAQVGRFVVQLRRLKRSVHPMVYLYKNDAGETLPPVDPDLLMYPRVVAYEGAAFLPVGLRTKATMGNLWQVECASAREDMPAYLAQKCLDLIDWCTARAK